MDHAMNFHFPTKESSRARTPTRDTVRRLEVDKTYNTQAAQGLRSLQRRQGNGRHRVQLGLRVFLPHRLQLHCGGTRHHRVHLHQARPEHRLGVAAEVLQRR